MVVARSCCWNVQFLCRKTNWGIWTFGHALRNCRDVLNWTTIISSCHLFEINSWTSIFEFFNYYLHSVWIWNIRLLWSNFTNRSIQTFMNFDTKVTKYRCIIVSCSAPSLLIHICLSSICHKNRPIKSWQPNWLVIQILHSYC